MSALSEQEVFEKVREAESAANVLFNNKENTNGSSDILGAINILNQTLPVILSWFRENTSVKDFTSEQLADRNEQLGEEVRRRNEEDIIDAQGGGKI